MIVRTPDASSGSVTRSTPQSTKLHRTPEPVEHESHKRNLVLVIFLILLLVLLIGLGGAGYYYFFHVASTTTFVKLEAARGNRSEAKSAYEQALERNPDRKTTKRLKGKLKKVR